MISESEVDSKSKIEVKVNESNLPVKMLKILMKLK